MVTVPQQILDSLDSPIHSADVVAWATVGAAPGTSLGETHVLVTRSRTLVLSRPTPWEELRPMTLTPGGEPSVAAEGFETWLIVPLKGGGDARVPLTALDRTALDPALAAIAEWRGAHAATEAAEPVVSARVASDPDPEPDPDEGEVAAAELVVPEPPVLGATFEERVDTALDRIERVGRRAGRHGGFSALDVTAHVGALDITVRLDRATLARLSDQADGEG